MRPLGLALLLAALGLQLAVAPARAAAAEASSPDHDAVSIPVVFPEHSIDEPDAYLCTAVTLPDRPLKLVGVQPTSDEKIVHHMLLFGCARPARTDTAVWPCKMQPVCGTSSESVLYGWGRNAPAMAMPEGAGFSVGPGTGIRTIVLQMHYLNGRPANDTSGLVLHLSGKAVDYSAGMAAFAASFVIPPRTPRTLAPNACCYSGWEPLHGFAARVHTHGMGREVFMDHVRASGTDERAVALDPRKPQGFYPVQPQITFLPGDTLAMACAFDSTDVDHEVRAGHTASDEMCNLYLMLYSHLPFFWWCLDSSPFSELHGPGGLPTNGVMLPETAVWKPPTSVEVKGAADYPIGQVAGVASRGDGLLWAFHRGARSWQADGSVADAGSGGKGAAMEAVEGTLDGPVVLELDPDSGKVLQGWGAGRFSMPHMITPDHEGNLWVTDVALHQAIKLSPSGKELMALGQRGQPGAGKHKFCKPTQVAVGRDGAIFVSDGYCNSRVAEFKPDGTWVRDYQTPDGLEPMLLPHSLAIQECAKLLLVAERERGNVQAFEMGTGAHKGTWQLGDRFGHPYALTLGPYGTTLALAWKPGTSPTQAWVVALAAEPGVVAGSWPLQGLQLPHDLTLLPAPLALTGAGERLLSVVVGETRDDGQALHKFILAHADLALNGSAPAAAAKKADSGGGNSDEQLTAAEQEEAAKLAAAKSSAAAHFGGSTHAHAPGAAGQPSGEEPEEAELTAAVGHSLVKPVDGGADGTDAGGEQQQQQQKQKQKQAAAAAVAAEEDDLEEEQQQQPPKKAAGGKGEEAPRTGHTMVQPVDEEAAAAQQQQQQHQEEHQQPPAKQAAKQQPANEDEAEEEDWEQLVAGFQDESGKAAVAQQQQQQQQAGDHEEVAVAVRAAGGAEPEQEALQPSGYDLGMSTAAVLPAVLGVMFVAVALVAWSRLQHWRGRGGAGYQATARSGAGADGSSGMSGGDRVSAFGVEGHLGDALGHRGAGTDRV